MCRDLALFCRGRPLSGPGGRWSCSAFPEFSVAWTQGQVMGLWCRLCLLCFWPLLHLSVCPRGPVLRDLQRACRGCACGWGWCQHPGLGWPSPQWMRARWTSDPCYAFFGVDGTECSFLTYLSEVEWFCPPLPWRNQTAAQMAPKPLPKVQVSLGSGWAREGLVDRSAGLLG